MSRQLWTAAIVVSVLFFSLNAGAAFAQSTATGSFRNHRRRVAEIHRHLAQVNKPAVKSIQVQVAPSLILHSLHPLYYGLL